MITSKLGRLWSRFSSVNRAGQAPANELPLREDLFSVDQLEQHARTIAVSHEVSVRRAKDRLIPRLDENERILLNAHALVTAAVTRNRPVAPAAEWLLDNFYLIEEQIRTARRHLPRSYSQELPRLRNGPAAHHPRVYGIALDLISHVDGRVDAVSLNGFIASYQTVNPLTLGELWAIPIMLRLALIENLRRVAARVVAGRRDADEADDWAERMVFVVDKNPTDLILVMADMARANPPLTGAFLAEMTRHLQGQSPYFALALSWLEQRVADLGFTTTECMIQADGQAQAADHVSMGNSINSLRFLGANDWREFVEAHSVVEQILRDDPAGVYAHMDFATRDHYRHVIEQVARRGPFAENDVARKAVQLAQAEAIAPTADEPRAPGNVEDLSANRLAHVGYFLIGRGRSALERLTAMHSTLLMTMGRFGRENSLCLYLMCVLLLTVAITTALPWWSGAWSLSALALSLFALPLLMGAVHMAIGIVNWWAILWVKPEPLPRIDFSKGIPPRQRTMVVVPTMLTNPDAVAKLLDGLEVRYLANRDGNLHFALLTDFVDAPRETMPGDDHLVELAQQGIEQLNQKYYSQRPGTFFLFHRPRRWNARDRVWMGYERKRGKLAEFNALLRGNAERFATVVGATAVLAEVRYVITLDTDTQLPHDSARKMVGAMAHPLNRPVFDSRGCRVVEGHAILQPRVGVSLPSSRRSRFVRWCAGDSGVDPYTRVVSDLYQDLFGEGSFIGKGIYDVDAFDQSCGHFPENTILSHDLLEGAYARSGLLSDVELYEDFPARYPTDVSRRHRWMRGDWQIAWWLLPWVSGRSTRLVLNPISVLSWWKILDNLRRSLVPVALLVLLLLSWFLADSTLATPVLLFVLATIGTVPLLAGLTNLIRKPVDQPLLSHLRGATFTLVKDFTQFFIALIFLPYEAYVSLDAIIRTLVRVLVTKRKLLEWKTSGDAELSAIAGPIGFVRTMWIGPTIAVAALVFLSLSPSHWLVIAGPLLGLWFVSPVVAWWLSQSLIVPPPNLSDRQRVHLEQLSRRTWRYFEVFVTEREHWLPPDNVHDHPTQVVASRTSPTNIGVALLANLAALDFGYSSTRQLLDRTRKTLGTLARLERFRGHYYNWYDTRTLQPLPPRYVSTVDSGNLAGHLLVLRGGLLELIDGNLLPARIFGGLRDTIRVLHDVARGHHQPENKRGTALVASDVLRKIQRLDNDLEHLPGGFTATLQCLDRLARSAAEITNALGTNAHQELQWWARALERSCADHRDDLSHVAPWTELPPFPQGAGIPGTNEKLERPGKLSELIARLDAVPSPRALAGLPKSVLPLLDEILADLSGQTGQTADLAPLNAFLQRLRQEVVNASQRAATRIKNLEQLAQQCQELAEADFVFLQDPARELFSIGYNVDDQRLDASFYDLLASEARLASFLAIAQGQVGQAHWFALGRLLTTTGGAPTLLSWSGSMFEYLMPLLVMPTYDNTLLDQTYRAVVARQIEYGRQRGVPWGMSESGYNRIDLHVNYQYRAFGVPGLGLKRGLAEELVVAPYASVLALMVQPEAACRNLERLAAEGRAGAYGLYEAIDYTPSRQLPGATSVTVRQFMAHHEGMSLLALAYVLLDRPMQRRFAADPMFRAADLLLQERMPRACAPLFPHVAEARATHLTSSEDNGTMRIFTDPHGAVPEVHLLSNGQYHVVITSAGGGYSRWRDLAVTRWREDCTRDCWGSFCYLRDLDSEILYSTTFQPTLKPGKHYEAIFTQGRAEFRRRDEKIKAHTEISVSPEEDIELRRTTLTNRSEVARVIEVTSYAEVVLAPQAQDLSHPAFSNLFVQTELVRHRRAIVCTRRPRSAEERPPWLVHLMTVRGTTIGEASFETDRMKFIGRGRTLVAPAAMERGACLSDSAGSVLDPVVCIRQVIRLEPNETVQVDLITGVAESREAITALMEKYQDPSLAERVFKLAWTHGHILLRQLNASEADAQTYGRLAGAVIYASRLRRAKPSVLINNRRGQPGLWGYGISGDLPIVLVCIRDHTRVELVRQAVQAHAYWRKRGLSVDLVIWNEDDSVYRQVLLDAIRDLIAASPEAGQVDKPGGIFVRRGEQMSDEDRTLLFTVARVVLFDEADSLHEQVERRGRTEVMTPKLEPSRLAPTVAKTPEVPRRELVYFNGLGGFTPDGREYVILLGCDDATPAPWVNVIANARFGTVVSESGSVYTWSENSHEFRLTPWHNDPVTGSSGEAIYIRDEETGRFWSPSPLPARGANQYVARHGFGYSTFEYAEEGIHSELCLYVATDAPVKFARLKITNRAGRSRQVSVTSYWEWVLGELRDRGLLHVVTELDPISGALFARNYYSPDFADRVAFVDCSEATRTITADRTEFLGRNGTLANPAAMRRIRLSGRVGAGLDPCAAIQVPFTLHDGQQRDMVFILGSAHGEEQARQLVNRFRGVASAQNAQEGVWHYWHHCLGAMHVETPDPAVNLLANGWLVYQTLACRMWGRTGFYQSGGAFGFRDQLQDAMALVHAEPGLLRQHLLLAAERQFADGDVQHWWHPPLGRGVRTHFSDDYLWLPYATCRYVAMTGDTGVLDERLPFLQARALQPDEEANYDLPQVSAEIGTLYEHCVRAINNGLRMGSHGLPLIGCGDWNDGMNQIGKHGRGESVWLAFFLYDVLLQFIAIARRCGDVDVVDRFALEAGRLRGNIEEHGWDGEWYRRAYFDDGTPLGSALNAECQIDSISQSWSVLSGAGTNGRQAQAMEHLYRRLVRPHSRLIQLLDPPFDVSELNPGYIKGYVPGVRENGGQYTHGAIWAAMAFAAMKDANRAWELFAMINPINHAKTPEGIEIYRVEPYVVAADVYGVAPHEGRGGWTWYTGSAGWMYRLITESLLGLRLDVDKLRFAPCFPTAWTTYKIHYRYRDTFYHITFRKVGIGSEVSRVMLDDVVQTDYCVPLADDRINHHAIVETA